ncbi:MAG: phytanoyl-CoA dioxygenase family protein [Actinomycetota bacterium]|nr:phytanoyl-CoA dioxygenase family protein [Actinomycetota bacterium]
MLVSNGYVLDESPDRIGNLERVPQSERSDRGALWSRIRRHGYLYLSGHLDPAVVNDFREYYFAKLAPTGLLEPGTAATAGIGSESEIDRALMREILFDDIVPGPRYAALTSHPEIREWFSWFFDEDVHLHKRKIIRHIRPGEAGIGTATQAHYDLVYLREGSDRVLSMWIPLGDCPREMGGLAYLEGSHHWALADERDRGLRPPARSMTADLPGLADEHNSRWLLADYRAGDVVVHSAYMVHASTDNVDSERRIRLSTDIRYQSSADPIDWRWQEHWNPEDGL